MSSSTAPELDLSKPLAPGQRLTVYVVHKGSFTNEKTGERGLTDPVCTRTTYAEAESVALTLDEAQEGVYYLKFVASNFFPLAKGTGEELRQMAERPDVQAAWDKVAAAHRKRLYQVQECPIVEDADEKTFHATVGEEAARRRK